MKQIKLSQNKEAIVDDKDYEYLNQWKWSYHTSGYAYRMKHAKRVKGETRKGIAYYMHREVMKAPDGKLVDHINRNKLDNRKSNLRLCSQRQNLMNRNKPSNNTSGYKGVSYCKRDKVWEAYINADNKKEHIGKYKNIKDAVVAYNNRAYELYGEYAFSNSI